MNKRESWMGKGWLMGVVGLVASLLMPTQPASADTNHAGLTWTGAGTCLTCHTDEATEVHGSVHYQWQGTAPDMVNGPTLQGKLNTAFNSYCINILGNWGACGSCHVGLGAMPTTSTSQSQLANIDCLMCHQKDYKRKKVNGVFVPDTANMTITMDQAVQTVHKPVRSNCIQCHAKGGGGDNYKRGDLALAHATTTDKAFDVHMATTGRNYTCQTCHKENGHKMAGRGSDLRETDLDIAMGCSSSSCHSSKSSTTSGHSSSDISKHVGRVACQSCHIPTYARNATDTTATEATETARDWRTPEWNTGLNRWEPLITKANNLKPAYKFWNGSSWGYNLGDVATFDSATGRYATSRPVGGINDRYSKLFPFKYKTSVQPFATNLGELIALDTAVYFATGDADAATESGLTNMGFSPAEPYTFVEDDTYQLITHEVGLKTTALTCSKCHTSSATQMKLVPMGYNIKASASTVCKQCHEYKSPTSMSYTSLHKEHVTEERYDCSFCHNFTRPERGLKTTK